MPLTLAQAQKIIQAAIAQSQTIGIKAGITVVDAHGDLVAAARMDGARFITADVSKGKASVSAMFGQPSAAMEQQKDMAPMQSLLLMSGGRLVFRQGAVPIMQGGEMLGAVGVSGGSPQQDEDVAKAASAAL